MVHGAMVPLESQSHTCPNPTHISQFQAVYPQNIGDPPAAVAVLGANKILNTTMRRFHDNGYIALFGGKCF